MALRTILVCAAFAGVPVSATSTSSTSLHQVPGNSARQGMGPPRTVRIASVEGITEYRLANGLRVLLAPDPSRPTIAVHITYLVGPRNEGYGEKGMAHFLEHLLFKGTARHPNIPKEMAERGISFNGYTNDDHVGYYEVFGASDATLRWALALEADRMLNTDFTDADVQREMAVVRNEGQRFESDPYAIVDAHTKAAAFLWHNYGSGEVASDVENMSRAALMSFYRTYYRPDNAVLIVAGHFTEQATLRDIERIFAGLPATGRSKVATMPSTHTIEPPQEGERSILLRRAGRTALVEAGYRIPAVAHPDYAVAVLAGEILGSPTSGRLASELMPADLAAQVRYTVWPNRDPYLLRFTVTVGDTARLDPARVRMLELIEQRGLPPLSGEEVERARRTLLNQLDLSAAPAQRLASTLAIWSAAGDWRLLFVHRDRVRTASLSDIGRVLNAYFNSTNRTLAIFLPADSASRVSIPASPGIALLVDSVRGDITFEVGESLDADPESLADRTLTSTLPSGLTVTLLPKRTRGGSGVARLDLRFGDETSLRGRGLFAELLGQMILRGGGGRTRNELADDLARLQATANISSTANRIRIQIEARQRNLAPALQLVAAALRRPSLDSAELTQVVRERAAFYREQMADPIGRAMDAYLRQVQPLPSGHPLVPLALDESLAQLGLITADSLRMFHREFLGVTDASLTAVGDFDHAALLRAADDALGDWASSGASQWAAGSASRPSKLLRIEVPDRPNALFVAGQSLDLRDTDPDYPALLLASHLLGAGPGSRLFQRVRVAEGLSYGVSTVLVPSNRDGPGELRILAIHAPANEARVRSVVLEEVTRMLRDGFTPAEIRRGQHDLLERRARDRASDGQLALLLEDLASAGQTLALETALIRKVKALTPNSVLQAIRRHVSQDNLIIVQAGAFRTSGSQSP